MVALIFPMLEEAEQFAKREKLEFCNQQFPKATLTKNNIEISVYLCGVGKTKAAACAAYAIQDCNPDLVVLAGSCCGILDVPVCTAFVPILCKQVDFQFDTNVAATPVPELIEAVRTANTKLGAEIIPMTVFATGDLFLEGKEAKKAIVRDHNAYVYDMESASVATICHMFGKDFTAVRVVSDNINHGMDDFERNLPAVSTQIADILQVFFSAIS